MDKSYRISLCGTREHAPFIDSDDTVNVETVCFLELLDSLIGAAARSDGIRTVPALLTRDVPGGARL